MDAEEYMEHNADEQMKHAEPLEKKKARMAKKVGNWKVTKKVHQPKSIRPAVEKMIGSFQGGSNHKKGGIRKIENENGEEQHYGHKKFRPEGRYPNHPDQP